MTELPREVHDVLRQLLPLYQEDRKRWPLWTYRRATPEGTITSDQLASLVESSGGTWSGDPTCLPETVDGMSTWAGQGTDSRELRWSWAARLRWSAMLPINSVVSDLDRLAQASGLKLVLPLGSTQVGETWTHSEDSERDVPVGFAPGTSPVLLRRGDEFVPVKVPLRLQARTAGAFSVTEADGVPDVPANVELPIMYLARGFLDDHDFEELLSAIGAALLRGTPPRLSKFLRRIEEVAKQKADRPEGWTELDKEDFDPLAGDVFRDAGLLPNTQGGSGDKIREPLLGRLRNEAEEIVSEVRGWKLDEEGPEYSEAVSTILRSDGCDQSPRAQTKLGLQLRFPFLTLPEMQLVRGEVKVGVTPDPELADRFPYLDREERASLYGKGTTQKRAASILLRGRLPGNLGYGGLQKRLN